MSKSDYFVEETLCFPNSFKVRNGWDLDNSPINYFPTREKAQKEADSRNRTSRVNCGWSSVCVVSGIQAVAH